MPCELPLDEGMGIHVTTGPGRTADAARACSGAFNGIPATLPGGPAAPAYPFTDAHFDLLRDLVSKHAAIHLNASKRELVYGRLARRIRSLGLPGFDAYCDLLTSRFGNEIENLINAITTNLTSFFRENHHFEYLAHTVMPKLMRDNAEDRRIRIWSAGCSTGEEPYSIAMIVREALGDDHRWDVKILATDIDSNVIATARAGRYPANRQHGIGESRLQRWFTRSVDGSGEVTICDELRDLIRYAPLNLMDTWPFDGPFDAIFCRNVVIYFDPESQRILFSRFGDVLARHGSLFIGHSESMLGACTRFELVGRTTYSLSGAGRLSSAC